MLDLHRLRLLKEFAARGNDRRHSGRPRLYPVRGVPATGRPGTRGGRDPARPDRAVRRAHRRGCPAAAHAERILAQVEEAEADLSAQEREPTGRVSVAAFPTAAAAFAPALARSLRAHPRLTLLLRQTQKDEGLSSVRWGEVEVALVDDWTGHLAEHRGGRAAVLPSGARPAGPRRPARPPAGRPG